VETLLPITDLKNRAAETVQEIEESGRTVVVTQHGEAKAVLMAVAVYERWRKSLALLKLLSHSEADVAAGRLLSDDEAFARAERVIPKKRRRR
jgi:prevent-host-death family protein